MTTKKKTQLGMNPSTASNRLVKDVLWKLVVETGQDKCYRCGFLMSRETFSIEHKEAWLDSEDPVGLYFDLNNISFSHLRCNVGDRRQTVVAKCGTYSKYTTGCRCQPCTKAKRGYAASNYTKEGRKEKYRRTGH